MKKFYYDLHVFYSTASGFSVGLEIESYAPLSEDEVKVYAVENEIIDADDAQYVNYVTEIEYHEYVDLIV